MRQRDVTKKMLENVAVKFNANIIDIEASKPLPTGKALDKIGKPDYTKDIKKIAEDLLREGDEQFFHAKDLEILSVIGVDLKKCGLVMTADQGTAGDKAEGGKETEDGKGKKSKGDKPVKEVQPDQKKSTKKTKGKSKTVAENAEGNEGGGEDKTDDKKNKKKAAKSKDKKGPGVIASILQLIKDNGPIARESILDELTETFPDRDPKAMNKTVQAQIGGKKSPTRMEREKGIEFKIKDGKYSVA
jgi:hypothetical protein